MAMIDYGAIAFKNGKLISTDMVTPMMDTCGFSDKDTKLPGCKSSFDGRFFVTVGNKRLLFGFYKTSMHWFSVDSYEKTEGCECFGCGPYEKWTRWEKYYFNGNDLIWVIVKPKNGYYVAKFSLDGDVYKVYFGHGVDFEFYKKTRRVNFYRSPEYWMGKAWDWIKRKLSLDK